MKYHALFVIFEKKQQNLKLLSAANYRWRFIGLSNFRLLSEESLSVILSCWSLYSLLMAAKSYGPEREKTCLRGFGQSEFQTSLLSYRD